MTVVDISTPRDNNNVPLPIVADSLTSGNKTSTTPGTPVRIVSVSTPCKRVEIDAYSTNKNTIAIGGSTVRAENQDTGTKTGLGEQLIIGASRPFDIDDAYKLYMDVAESGDGISFNIYS